MKDIHGNKTTPKQLAQAILLSAIDAKFEFFDEDIQVADLSKREQEQVHAQAVKLRRRIAKLLQHDPRFWWEIKAEDAK